MEMEDDSTKRKGKKQGKWVGSQWALLSTHFPFNLFTLFYMVLHIVKNYVNAYVLYLHFNNLDGIKWFYIIIQM
jgi:hypothetical protein